MAQDATGTPTSPDSIPTYNTAVDAPSGKGLNNIVAALQTALSARVSKPASIATGEVPVWNGSTFVRSSVTQLGTTSIGTGTPAAGKYVDGATGAWTTLPSSSIGQLMIESTTTTGSGSLPVGSFSDILAATFTANGTSAYVMEFTAPSVTSGSGNSVRMVANVAGTDTGILWETTASASIPIYWRWKFTPSAGSITVKARGGVTGGGTPGINAGAGANNTQFAPMFLRVFQVT